MKLKHIITALILLFFSCEKAEENEILKFYGDAYEDIGYSIVKSGGDYLIAGQFDRLTRDSTGIRGERKKLVVVHTSQTGAEKWKDTIPGNRVSCGKKILAFDDGSSIVIGYTIDPDPKYGYDIYFVRFGPGGEGGTEKVFRAEGNQYANDIVTSGSGFIILGTTDVDNIKWGNPKGKKDILFLSVSNDLEITYTEPYGFAGNDEGMAIKANGDGTYTVVGTSDRFSLETNSEAGNDVFMLKVNDLLKVYYGPQFITTDGDQWASDFEILSDGYLIAGTGETPGGLAGHLWHISGDIFGTITTNVVERKPSTINAISKYRSNSFVVAGQAGPASSGSMMILAADGYGSPVPGKMRVAGGTGNQIAYDVITDGDDIIAVGKNAYENNSMITLLRFRF